MKYYRRVIKVSALDSPNVQHNLLREKRGLPPEGDIIPGVLSYAEYVKRRKLFNLVDQCISLDGEFYEGAELLLFPPDWLNRAQLLHLDRPSKRIAKSGGCDPGEGVAQSTMCAGDEYGVIELLSVKTPDTNVIPGLAIAFMNQHGIPPEKFCFDRGGGGKQHADRLRAMGYPVRTVAFGESIAQEPKRGLYSVESRKEVKEKGYEYKNRRAEMYWEASELMDPNNPNMPQGYSIPSTPSCMELRRQLGAMPKLWDEEGRQYLPPKNRRKDRVTDSKVRTIEDLIGCSPDEADAFVLMVHGLLHKSTRYKAGAV